MGKAEVEAEEEFEGEVVDESKLEFEYEVIVKTLPDVVPNDPRSNPKGPTGS